MSDDPNAYNFTAQIDELNSANIWLGQMLPRYTFNVVDLGTVMAKAVHNREVLNFLIRRPTEFFSSTRFIRGQNRVELRRLNFTTVHINKQVEIGAPSKKPYTLRGQLFAIY